MISRTIAVIIFGMFTLGIVVPGFVYARNVNAVNSNEFFSGSYKNSNNSLPALPNLKLPVGSKENVKGFLSGTSSDSEINFSRLLNTENFSSNDLGSGLKAVAVLAINLFLIVIQTVAAVLKALLPFLQ